jgi:hypothetical protein
VPKWMGWQSWASWIPVSALVLAFGGSLSCGGSDLPETTEISRLVYMNKDARESEMCGKVIRFDATALASPESFSSPDSIAYYNAEDPNDERAKIVIVSSGNPPAAGTKLSVSGRVSCDPPFPTPARTFFVREMSRATR